MFTGPICKAARALVEIDLPQFAALSGLSEDMIANFENGAISLPSATADALVRKLEGLGAILIPEEGAVGAGVRLKFSRSVTSELEDIENEGGPARPDDVP